MNLPERPKSTPLFGPARIVEVEPGICCAGAWGNLTITRWQSRATGPAVECLARANRVVRAEYPSGISSVHLICEGAGMPTPEAREGLLQLMNAQVEQLKCLAVVIGGTGFWASAIRGMITGLRAMSSRAYELRLAGSSDELLAWLPEAHTQRTGIKISARDLERSLATANQWDAGALSAPHE